jgi:hypothetical protein
MLEKNYAINCSYPDYLYYPHYHLLACAAK